MNAPLDRTTAEPVTDDTAFLITDAGLDALRTLPVVPDADETCPDADCPDVTAADREVAPYGPGGFTPDTREKADWVLRLIARHRGEAALIRENAERMARQEEAEAERLEWQFGPALQDLARRELAGGKRKSLTLYHGVLGFRTKPAGVQIGDPKAALAWARQNLPGAVVETIDRAAVAKALLESGGPCRSPPSSTPARRSTSSETVTDTGPGRTAPDSRIKQPNQGEQTNGYSEHPTQAPDVPPPCLQGHACQRLLGPCAHEVRPSPRGRRRHPEKFSRWP